eukprot:sb/3469418/
MSPDTTPSTTPDTTATSKVMCRFQSYRSAMDSKNDKHERIVKISRDITIASKRIIFGLHRILPDNTKEHEGILKEAEGKLTALKPQFVKIGEELKGEDVYRFHRAFTNGVQEFIEAATFHHGLKSLTIPTISHLQEQYMGPTCPLLLTDYLQGLADLTGELMRMCICFCSRGGPERGHQLRELLYQVNSALTMVEPAPKMKQKMEVMGQSLGKCERANYTASVRGAEVLG